MAQFGFKEKVQISQRRKMTDHDSCLCLINVLYFLPTDTHLFMQHITETHLQTFNCFESYFSVYQIPLFYQSAVFPCLWPWEEQAHRCSVFSLWAFCISICFTLVSILSASAEYATLSTPAPLHAESVWHRGMQTNLSGWPLLVSSVTFSRGAERGFSAPVVHLIRGSCLCSSLQLCTFCSQWPNAGT